MIDIKSFRHRARLLLEHACGGAHGRTESDPVYREVTEGMDPGVGKPGDISSCGFLPSYLWFSLGVRCSFVNRRENDRYGYRNGLNIALLCAEKVASKMQGVPNSRPPTPDSVFNCGDVLVVWNKVDSTDAHTCVVLESMGQSLLTADFGQPGAALKTRPLTQRQVFDKVGAASDKLFLGSKQIRRWVPLAGVLEEAQRRGELVDTSEPVTTPMASPAPIITDWPRLSQGDSGPAVRHLQERLNAHGTSARLVTDAHFGAKTRDAVEAFQRASRKLKDDGVVGPKTWAELERDPGHDTDPTELAPDTERA